MIRRIIHIDEEKCNGCGACAAACHESAIGMVDGKAKLLRDDYCDGLGDCLPACPTDAISFVEREAAPYDEAAVAAHLGARNGGATAGSVPAAAEHRSGCPGSAARTSSSLAWAVRRSTSSALEIDSYLARASPIAWEKSNSAIVYTIHFFMRSLYSVMEPHTAFAQSSTSSTYPHTRSHPAEPRTSLVTYGIAGPGRIIPDQRRQRPA